MTTLPPCPIPNPNLLAGVAGHPFFPGCPLPADALNRMPVLSGAAPHNGNLAAWINVTGTSNALQDSGVASTSIAPTVQVINNAALAALPLTGLVSGQSAIYRQGYYSSGDGGGARYTWSSSACSLNFGVGDGGSQVQNTAGGCWLADFSNNPANIMQWGAIGNGVTDDTTVVQAAWSAASSLKIPLYLGPHLYKIGAISLTSTSASPIIGNQLTSYTAGQEPTLPNCTSGFVASSTNIPALITVAHDAVLRNFCIKDAAAGTNTSGSAINLESVCDNSASCPQSYNNTVDHVLIDGAFLGIALSGQFHNITNNLIENIPANGGGIRIGDKTNSGRSVQPNIYNNNIYGIFGGSASYALLIEDVGGPYITNNELNSTNYNYWINPGLDTSGANGSQNVQAVTSTSNFADTAITDNLRLDCQTGSFGMENGPSVFTGDWFGTTTGGSLADGIWIGATGSASACKIAGVLFDNVRVLGSGGNGISINSANDWSISINSSHICKNGSTKAGIELVAGAGNSTNAIIINDNTIGGSCDALGGSQAIGIDLHNNIVTIVGNDLSSNNTVAINGQPGGNSIVENNKGIDDIVASVASAATITLPVNPVIQITGTTTVNTMNAGYCCPHKTLVTLNGSVQFTGGNIADAFTSTQNIPILAQFIGTDWFLK